MESGGKRKRSSSRPRSGGNDTGGDKARSSSKSRTTRSKSRGEGGEKEKKAGRKSNESSKHTTRTKAAASAVPDDGGGGRVAAGIGAASVRVDGGWSPAVVGPWAGADSAGPYAQFPALQRALTRSGYLAGTGASIYGTAATLGRSPLDAVSSSAANGATGSTASIAANVALAQAYQTRMAALSTVAASLLGKRELLHHQLSRVQARMEEVAAARAAIERETLADTEAVLHRLRSAEGAKLSVLQTDADALAADIAAIDSFYSGLYRFHPPPAGPLLAMAAVTGSGGGLPMPALPEATTSHSPAVALEFMRAYPDLCAEADRLQAKAVKQEVDVRADDFPREMAVRCDRASRYSVLCDLVEAKDRIIMTLLRERDAAQRQRDEVLAATSSARTDGDRVRLDNAALRHECDELRQQVAAARTAAARDADRLARLERAAHQAVAAAGGSAGGGKTAVAGSMQRCDDDVVHGGDATDDDDAATDVAHWVRLTEQLTSELNEVTEKLVRVQAATGVVIGSMDTLPRGAPAPVIAPPRRSRTPTRTAPPVAHRIVASMAAERRGGDGGGGGTWNGLSGARFGSPQRSRTPSVEAGVERRGLSGKLEAVGRASPGPSISAARWDHGVGGHDRMDARPGAEEHAAEDKEAS